ncbi:MAG: rubrerythrin-like domain-containing protein [Haloplanus sp.]
MSERTSYECQRCQQSVSSIAYRAACPECGGTLRPRTVP